VRTVRPIDIFVYLNLQKTREEEMKNLTQPTLMQLQNYVKYYRIETLAVGGVTTAEIKEKIKVT